MRAALYVRVSTLDQNLADAIHGPSPGRSERATRGHAGAPRSSHAQTNEIPGGSDNEGTHAGVPSATQRRKTSTRDFGHAPSQGMEPLSRRRSISAECSTTSP